jgi:hypothetical protein
MDDAEDSALNVLGVGRVLAAASIDRGSVAARAWSGRARLENVSAVARRDGAEGVIAQFINTFLAWPMRILMPAARLSTLPMVFVLFRR